MDSDDLTREQARALKTKIAPMLGYLSRLKRRMTYRGFQREDPLMQAVLKSEQALHELHVATHYLSVDGGMKQYREDQAVNNWMTPPEVP